MKATLYKISHKGQTLNNQKTAAKFLGGRVIKAKEPRMVLSYFLDPEYYQKSNFFLL